MRTDVTLSDDHDLVFAVENARKMSPELFPPKPP
jgi:hypothetical protein